MAHGTTIISVPYNYSHALVADSRQAGIWGDTYKDTATKVFQISDYIICGMSGITTHSQAILNDVKSNCKDVADISNFFKNAEERFRLYCDPLLGKSDEKLRFGMIICSSSFKNESQGRVLRLLFNLHEVNSMEVENDICLAGSSKQLISQFAASELNVGKVSFNDKKSAIDFANRACFYASYYDRFTGGPALVYTTDELGKWQLAKFVRVLDSYEKLYDGYSDKCVLFLIYAHHGKTDLTHGPLIESFIKKFKGKEDVRCFHRLCEINVDENRGFHFHRLIFLSQGGAEKFIAEVKGKMGEKERCYTLVDEVDDKMDKVVQLFDVKYVRNEKNCIYIAPGSKELIQHFKKSNEYSKDHLHAYFKDNQGIKQEV